MQAKTKHKPPRNWSEYRMCSEGERWEIIGGEPFLQGRADVSDKVFGMAASPLYPHQHVLLNLALLMKGFLGKGRCRVIVSPFDVRLSESDCVEPDLMVVCDPRQIHLTHVDGPPKLVVEIVSPASVRHDRIRKLKLYAQYRVAEYWIVSLDDPLIEVLHLDGETYRMRGVYGKDDALKSPSFPRLRLAMNAVFDFPILMSKAIKEVRETQAAYSVKPKKRLSP